MHYRTLHIGDKEYRYAVGRSAIVVRGPNNERFVTTASEVTGIDDWERARWKGYDQVTPQQIKDWLTDQLESSQCVNG